MKTLSKFSAAVIALLITSAIVVKGQAITLGVKAGVNFSNIRGDYEDRAPSMLTGYHIGAMVDIPINNNFSIAPELLFTTKGAKEETTTTRTAGNNIITDEWDQTLKLCYVEIPILAMYKWENGLHLEAGPYIGFLTSATQKGTFTHVETGNGNAYVNNSIDVSSTSGYSSADFGLAFGAGYTFTSGLGFALRYDLGLTDIYNPEFANDYQNSTISISAYYMFLRQ